MAFAPVPLPPQDPTANADAPADPNDAYSKFTAPLVTNASRAKFTYGLNHGTLVPGKNVMSYVGRVSCAMGGVLAAIWVSPRHLGLGIYLLGGGGIRQAGIGQAGRRLGTAGGFGLEGCG